MDFIFIIFALVIFGPKILKAISAASKANTNKTSPFRPPANSPSSPANSPWKNVASRAQGPTARGRARLEALERQSRRQELLKQNQQPQVDYEARRNRARKAHQHKQRSRKAQTISEVRDASDNNRRRRADWGARAGPGILNAKTFLSAVVLGVLALYIFVTLQ